MNRLLLLAALVTLLAPAAKADHVWINEFHYDNAGGDVDEFVEVAVRSGPAFNAADFSIALYNGSSNAPYGTDMALTAFTASAPFPISGSSETITFYTFSYPSNGIQNGSPDGIALVNTVTNTVVEYLSYEGTMTAVGGIADGATSTDVGVSESGSMTGTSIGYTGAGQAAEGFVFNLIATPTIGAPNTGQTLSATAPIPVRRTLTDAAGWRLLSAPVQGVDVGTLAGINLVQSLVGQYPDFPDDNVYLNYTGTFEQAGNVTDAVTPGRGFFWYFFDQDINVDPTVFGGGTSQSYALPARQLAAAGPALTADESQPFAVTTDGFYMGGNPFDQPLAVTGVTQTTGGGMFQNNLQIYDAATGYMPVDRTGTATLPVWEGVFAEITGATPPVTLTYLAGSRSTSVATRSEAAGSRFALTLDGTVSSTGNDVAIHDGAAIVEFKDAAETGWDADDASKLTPPGATYALVAPVGTRDGAARRQAVLSLPTGDMPDVTFAFTTTHAGTFTLTADATGLPADATVRDLVTGTVAPLADGLSFTSDATDWTDRFVVSFGRTTAGESAPAAFTLGAAYPNPATAQATLALRVGTAQRVTATLVDALGRTVATVFDGPLAAGADQALVVPTARLSPGLYVVRVQGETFAEARRLTVVR